MWIKSHLNHENFLAVITDESLTEEFMDLHDADINLARHVKILLSISDSEMMAKYKTKIRGRWFLSKSHKAEVEMMTRKIIESI